MQTESRVHERNLVSWAKNRLEVVVFSADLTGSTEIGLFAKTYPERFFSMGVAEQNMMSFAAGMAREGFIPFVHTFAVFIYRQALNQIVSSIAYSNLPVKMFGFLPGLTTPGGATHQAIEDVAVMRAIPNMVIYEPGDATEIESVLNSVVEASGPVYIRMLRGETPRIFAKEEPFIPNKARVLSRGHDITLLSSGICTAEAMRVTAVLQTKGIGILHLHISTHKPFNDPEVLTALSASRCGVITMENHSIIGGLGSAAAELMAEKAVAKPLTRIGLKDTFAHGGSRPYLMRYYRLDASELVHQVEILIGEKLGINEQDLVRTRPESGHKQIKEEDL
jgi:transketolase